MKTLNENLINIDKAQVAYQERNNRMMAKAGAWESVQGSVCDSGGEDSESEESFRGSSHSIVFLPKSARRGSEGSLASVSLGGEGSNCE